MNHVTFVGVPARTRACLFDLDGVLTRTAGLHARAWQEVFDAFLRERARRAAAPAEPDAAGERLGPFEPGRDYTRYLDGRTRFLEGGVDVYDDAVSFVRAVRAAGLRTAVVSSSAGVGQILRATELEDLFDVEVDAVRASREGLPGKPAPDTFLAAAADLGVPPSAAVVFEDAVAGVEAGRAGGSTWWVSTGAAGTRRCAKAERTSS